MGFTRLISVRGALVVLLVGLALLAAACGGDDEEAAPPATTEASAETEAPAETGAPVDTAVPAETTEAPAATTIQQPGQCGAPDGQGQEASGDPIKIGAVVTDIAAGSFTPITNVTKAFFDCVNANGGIGGRPVEYIVENDQGDPNAAVAAATKLIENDQVLGISGSTSFVDCTANHELYESTGYNVIVAGIPPECFNTPNIAAVNMGPYYSATGAAQAIVSRGAKSVVGITSSAPGNEYNNDGAVLVGQAAGLPTDTVFVDTPVTDPNSVALDLVNRAGDGGGVVLEFTAPDALPILQAAEAQGLLDKVLWSCATPCNDSRVAAALGPQWNDHFFVNAEFNLIDSPGTDQQHYIAMVEQYAPDEAARLSSFGQMGYLSGKFMTEALLQANAQGELTQESVNAAVRALMNQSTDILCKPWYFGDFPTHLPNNTDYTVTLHDNVFVEADPCFDIAAVNEQIQQVRADEAELIDQGLLSPTDAITDLGYTPPS